MQPFVGALIAGPLIIIVVACFEMNILIQH